MTNRALLVGIDNYPNPVNNLNSCVNDTKAFQSMLTSSYGFNAADITMLHDQDATYANVTEALDALLCGAVSGDQLVYFHSSHGWRHLKGDTEVEELVLYGEFLSDTELVKRTQTVPPGVLTVVVDTCHSGGMKKEFFPDGEFGLVRTKVYQPSPEELAIQDKAFEQVTKVKFFGRKPTADAGTIIGNFDPTTQKVFTVPASKDVGDLEINATLFAACTAEQTAAAGSRATKMLSAFTFGLTSELDPRLSLEDQRAMVAARLVELNMRQTPVLFVPTAHPEFAGQTFITRQSPSVGQSFKDFQPDIATKISDVITSLKRSGGNPATAHYQGGKTMTTYADPTTAAIHEALDELRRGNGSPCQPSTTTKSFGLPSRFSRYITDCFGTTQSWLDANPGTKVVVAEAPTKSSPDGEHDLDGADYASKELWEGIAFGLSAPIYAAQAPTTKGTEGIPADLVQNEKFWNFAASVALSVVVPAVRRALNGKDFDPGEVDMPEIPEGVDKGWLSRAWGAIREHVVPRVINALSQS